MSEFSSLVANAMRFLDTHNGAVTAIATIVIAVFTLALVIVSNHQEKLTRAALNHTISTDVTTQRAYLGRTAINTIVATDDGNFVRAWQFMPVWQNNGRTPAKDVRFRSSIPLVIDGADDIPLDFDPQFIEVENATLITIGANQPFQGGPTEVAPDDIIKLCAQEIRIFLTFRVEYRDVFAGTPIRISQHCEEMRFTGLAPITRALLPVGTKLPVTFYGHSRLQIFS